MSTGHMLSLAEHFSGVSIAGVPQMTVPVVLVETGSYLYQGYYYGDVEFPLEPGITAVIDRFLGLTSTTNTMTGKPLPADSTITVSVSGGTVVARQASIVANQLKRHGFHVTSLSSATPWGKRSETVVYHADNSVASLGAAQAVLHTIAGPAVMALGPVPAGARVRVVTGSDISVIPPASAPSTTTTVKKGHATTTTTTAITVTAPNAVKRDPAMSAPTPVTQTLQPWDPRSCGPHGTPGP